MSDYSKQDYQHMAYLRVQALQEIAKALGAEHTVTKMMGSCAWGRSAFEPGPPDDNLRHAVRHVGALDGIFQVLNTWARDHDRGAQRVMLALWPRGFCHAPSEDRKQPAGRRRS